jgi:2-haloacid dehalogenase
MIELTEITHLSFDCYGTLIDWERGILEALQPLFQERGANISAEILLQRYATHEARLEAESWQPYRDILRAVTKGIAEELGLSLSNDEQNVLLDSIGKWPPFSDTVKSLRRLQRNFRLVILSNVDDALFALTAKQLEVAFAEIITAEQVRSYKPGEAHFREALRRLQVSPKRVLHVSQSAFHDHVPAKRLGFGTAWVKRPSRRSELGLTQPASVQTDLVVSDLEELTRCLMK